MDERVNLRPLHDAIQLGVVDTEQMHDDLPGKIAGLTGRRARAVIDELFTALYRLEALKEAWKLVTGEDWES